MYLLTLSLHKESVRNSKHASIAQKVQTTVDEVRMWSWPNLRYYPEIRTYRGATKTHGTCVSILSESDRFPNRARSDKKPKVLLSASASFVRYANVSG